MNVKDCKDLYAPSSEKKKDRTSAKELILRRQKFQCANSAGKDVLCPLWHRTDDGPVGVFDKDTSGTYSYILDHVTHHISSGVSSRENVHDKVEALCPFCHRHKTIHAYLSVKKSVS